MGLQIHPTTYLSHRVENTNNTHIHFSTGILNGQSKLSELPVTHFQSTIVTIDVAVFSMRINAYHRVNIIGVIKAFI